LAGEGYAGREWRYFNCNGNFNERNTSMAAQTGLFGSHPLTTEGIDAAVVGVGPGAYALGRQDGNTFYVDYVGRSDTDLKARLKNWTDTNHTHFKYGFFDSPQLAFNKECSLFHDFGGTENLQNEIHPARPNGSGWKCARCNVFS
jgi:hypothetical protein